MAAEPNEIFRFQILNYIRNGRISGWDKALSFISPELPYIKNAGTIAERFKSSFQSDALLVKKKIFIDRYSGSNATAINISQYLEKRAGKHLLGAYVHGSIGSSEEVPYSDFDGLVILKNAAFANPKELFNLVRSLKETEKMMLEMDPLQHHGWFVLTERDLADYPEYYFPNDLFTYARCLFGMNSLEICSRDINYTDAFRKSFNNLSRSILKKLDSKNFLDNRYVFKNLLSEFMLLPAVYLQAKTGKGIFKKYSFAVVADEVGVPFHIMNEISAIRQEWNYTVSDAVLLKIRRTNCFKVAKFLKKNSAGLPSDLRGKFDEVFIHRMSEFVNLLNTKLSK